MQQRYNEAQPSIDIYLRIWYGRCHIVATHLEITMAMSFWKQIVNYRERSANNLETNLVPLHKEGDGIYQLCMKYRDN